MRWPRIALRVLAGVAACALGVAISQGESDTRAASGKARLVPDLVQVVPYDVHVIRRDGRRLLTFASAAENHGDGPLIIRGARPDLTVPKMTATQIVERVDGTRQTLGRGAGRLQYVDSVDHSHWHLLSFMRFKLRTEAGGSLGRDAKTGFCLGDRYDSDAHTPGEPSRPRYTGHCGSSKPELLRVTEGISVGYGDNYRARLEGQYIDITGLRAGRYVLVHRVNQRRRLLDKRRGNDVSSVLVAIRGKRVRVLRRCFGRARCALR